MRTKMLPPKFINNFLPYLTLFCIFIGISIVLLGVKSHLFILSAIFGSFMILSFLRLKNKVYYSMVFLIISMTVARESFSLPFELDAVFFILLIVAMLLSSFKQFLKKRNYILFFPILGYIVFNFVTTFFISPTFNLSLRQNLILVYRAFLFFAVVIAVRNLPNFRFRYLVWMQRILIINVLFSSIALVLYQILPTVLVHAKSDGTYAIKGTFQESNLLGVYALTVTFISLSTYLYSSKFGKRSVMYILVGVVGLVLSLTRSTWVGFILIFAGIGPVLAIKSKKTARTKYFALAGITLLLLSVFIFTIFLIDNFSVASFPLVSTITSRLSQLVDLQTNSAAGRIRIWSDALDLWRNNLWFGTGLLSYEYTGRVTEGSWLYNFVVQSLHDSGAIGTFFLIFFLIGIVWRLMKGYVQASSNQDKGMMLGYLLGILGLLFTSFTSSFVWSAYAWILFGLAGGHSLIVADQSSQSLVVNK